MGDHYVVTGGNDDRAPQWALSTVAKYSQSGLVEYLPSLNQGRFIHACSSFVSESGETVGFISWNIQTLLFIINIFQVLLVTGGQHNPGGTVTLLDSTEILESPGKAWRTLTTARLPSPRSDLRAGTAQNIVFLFGKNCLNVL